MALEMDKVFDGAAWGYVPPDKPLSIAGPLYGDVWSSWQQARFTTRSK